MLQRPLLLAMVLAMCIPLPASASTLVDIAVVDRSSGQPLPLYLHAGRQWLAGEPGQAYAVRLANRSPQRVLVVLSVDGVNAVSGQTAATSQEGYVLEPWQSHDISGWRKSLGDVARFYFTDLGDSYASRTGRPDNIGVIGIAVFNERPDLRRWPQIPTPERSPPPNRGMREQSVEGADVASAPQARQQVGTGHGEREWSPVGTTRFIRASSQPVQLTELRYDTHAGLVARGIAPAYWPTAANPAPEPRAFPNGFVADPPGW